MDPTYDRHVVKCPKCESNINLSIGRFPGGVNDSGGWVLKCSACGEKFAVPVKNPDDLSSVVSGASAIDSWDNELENKAEVLASHGVIDQPGNVKRLLIKEFGEPEDFYDLASRPLYQCGACNEPVDAAAYAALASHLEAVNSAWTPAR